MIALVVCSIIDVSLVKINDLINKYFIPIQGRLVLFSLNGSLCLLLQFFLIKYIRGSFKGDRMNKTLKVRAIHTISLISLIILAALIGFSIFQQFYYGYYSMSINIAIITISYGTAACLLIWKSILFYSWFRSSHNLIVLLYSHFYIDDCIQSYHNRCLCKSKTVFYAAHNRGIYWIFRRLK